MIHLDHNATLPAFSPPEQVRCKLHLATTVASMMGRKLEEDDWNRAYCAAKAIPYQGWSNLNIDVNYRGLGVEQKLLRVKGLGGRSIKSVCGTTMMHPSLTRSIRIDDLSLPADEVMRDVLTQYAGVISSRREAVRDAGEGAEPDMRIGWLLWEDSLVEFLYFEQRMQAPKISQYYAQWNETPARGARKGSKSLWIFDRTTNEKRYSVTTSAGIKIQPYFDVPSPTDPSLYFFRVQSEPLDENTVRIWVSAATASAILKIVGSLGKSDLSAAVVKASEFVSQERAVREPDKDLAQPLLLDRNAFAVFQETWGGVSDEHRAQLFLQSLQGVS